MSKAKTPDMIAMVLRLVRTYESATAQQRAEGRVWYLKAHMFALELAHRFDLTLYQAIGIIAVLSPGTSWERNMIDAVLLCAQGRKAKVTTYNANKEKALTLLQDANAWFDVVKGPKVDAFFSCILCPHAAYAPCHDRHALRAALDSEALARAAQNRPRTLAAIRDAYWTRNSQLQAAHHSRAAANLRGLSSWSTKRSG